MWRSWLTQPPQKRWYLSTHEFESHLGDAVNLFNYAPAKPAYAERRSGEGNSQALVTVASPDSPAAEAMDLKSIKRGFESHSGYAIIAI